MTVTPNSAARPGVNGHGLFGRFSPRPTPNLYNPACSSGPNSILQMKKPSSMSQEQYSGLTKYQKRQLLDLEGRDGSIKISGRPRLDLRYNQVKHKTPKHGAITNLPVNEKGVTPKTEQNIISLRDSLMDMPNKSSVDWYEDGMYQGGTPYGCKSVNLFDNITDIVSLYQKQPDGSNLFLTTCKLTEREKDHFLQTEGNFISEKIRLGQANFQ